MSTIPFPQPAESLEELPRGADRRETTSPPGPLIEEIRDLRRQGLTFEQIADELGMEIAALARHFVHSIDTDENDAAQRAAKTREHDFAITDLLLEQLLPAVVDGDNEAFKKTMTLLERRAKYLGLDLAGKSAAESPPEPKAPFLSKEQMIEKILERLNAK